MPTGVPRRERKVVTVLFCDLVGFTSQAESLDPEDVEAILRPYHARVRAELERHGGTVEKFIGDAVMALFGAPVAHEDDPERAVRAALAIRDFAVEDGLELRVGITTGEALVSLDASPLEGEGMASGDVVNTAARLQSAAPVNGVIADETTYRATRHAIDFAVAEPVEAKGKLEPIAVWTATGVHSRQEDDVDQIARTAFVGRERELDIICDAFERARQERMPQLVTLVGVPGIGKSRLVYELRRVVDADPELVIWRQGRSLSYGAAAFWALGEIVKAQAGILERETDEQAADKLREAVASVVPAERDVGWIEGHLRPLVGLETESIVGADTRSEAFSAWRRFIEAIAEERTLVLVFEDVHWADDGLLDFVDELVSWTSGVPLVVVCTARPELLDRRPGWGGGKLNATTLALSALSSDQTAEIVGIVLERSGLPSAMRDSLAERAGGNPLYAEQFAELHAERGSGAELGLPETLQGIIAARLDGLPSDEKALLQDAAVMGKAFWTGALERDHQSTRSSLHSLERKGFLARQRQSSVEHEDEWAFAHVLLRDVAYGQIPRAERATKHRAAAEWLANLGRPDDHATLIAHHWKSALDFANAAGETTSDLTLVTSRALAAAGDRAFAVSAYRSAAEYYDEALSLGAEDDAERAQLLNRLARAVSVFDDARAEIALEEARDALLATGDQASAANAQAQLWQLWWHRGDGDKASEHLARAKALARDLPAERALHLHSTIAKQTAFAGDATEALRLATSALATAEKLGVPELQAYNLGTIGWAKGHLGDVGGLDDLERAYELALSVSSSGASGIANNVAAGRWHVEMDLRRAMVWFIQGLEGAERIGGSSEVFLRTQVATFHFVLGHWDEAEPIFEALIRDADAGMPHYLAGDIYRGRARFREARADTEAALEDLDRALEFGRGTTDPQQFMQHMGTAVLAYETHGRPAEAQALAAELAIVASTEPNTAAWTMPYDFLISRASLGFEATLRRSLAESRFEGWRRLALTCLDRDFVAAGEQWARAGSPTWEARLRLRAAEELDEAGRLPEAEEQAARALDFYRGVDAPYFVRRCEALLAREATG